ncbi:WD repeat-containing protein 4 [Chytridiales sp. JEL 0842]|nr:WD repeat-containing protein 4 [Chytridiales sp. JEL 0842]
MIPKGTAAKAIENDLFPSGDIRSIAFHGETMIVTSDSKVMHSWDLSTMTRLGTWDTYKRPNVIKISPDGKFILVGDKFGDVFSIPIDDYESNGKLLLGHVSIITDLTLSRDGKYIITADRDEKIRVSKYPLTYDIQSFCLGHKEFVTCICKLPNSDNLLVSGGGDSSILVWDFILGERVQKVNLADAFGNKDGTPFNNQAVISIKSSPVSGMIAVLLDSLPSVILFDATKRSHLVLKQRIPLSGVALDIEFDKKGNLWIANLEGGLVGVSRYSKDTRQYESPSATDALVAGVNSLVPMQAETVTDFLDLVRAYRKITEEEINEKREKRKLRKVEDVKETEQKKVKV